MRELLFDQVYQLYATLNKNSMTTQNGLSTRRDVENVLTLMDKTRIYVVGTDAIGVVMDALRRYEHEVIQYRHPPHCPMWIEFEGSTAESVTLAFYVNGNPLDLLSTSLNRCNSIWITPQAYGYEHFVKVNWDANSKMVEFGYSAKTQEYCTDTPGEHWQKQDAHYGICFLSMLFHLLEARGTEIVQEPRSNRRVNVNGKIHVSQPTYTTISLSRPRKRYIHKGNAAPNHADSSEEEFHQRALIARHKRLLIPGEGRPWKSAQVITISPYLRRVKGTPKRLSVVA